MIIYNTAFEYLQVAEVGDIISIEIKNFVVKHDKIPKLSRPHTNTVVDIDEKGNIVYRPFRVKNHFTILNMQLKIVLLTKAEYEKLDEYLDKKPKNTIQYKKLLTPYSEVSNCKNLSDVKKGIRNIKGAVDKLNRLGKTAPSYYFNRLEKLEQKLK